MEVSSPLAGIRVLDLTSVLMGPYATQLLAQFGAEVIKLEPPEGDVMRHAGAMRNPGMGHVYIHANCANARSSWTSRKPEARPLVDKLVSRADVLVYNQRPRAMERLGLGYERVRELNPRIVYAGGLGFSLRGSRAQGRRTMTWCRRWQVFRGSCRKQGLPNPVSCLVPSRSLSRASSGARRYGGHCLQAADGPRAAVGVHV